MSDIARAVRGGACGVLALLLAGCADTGWGPSWNMSSRVRAPGDSLTIRRVMGENPDVAPLQSEHARWRIEERPRATLANPDAAMQNIPPYEPVVRPEVERDLRPRRGSSSPAALPPIDPLPTDPPARAQAPRLRAPAPRIEGGVVPIPGQAPGVITGGTERYQTFQQPGTAGGGVIIPQGNGLGTVIGPDGRTITVPLPR